MGSYQQTPVLLLLLGAAVIASAQCGGVQVNSNVGTRPSSTPGQQGRAAGEVSPFKPTGDGLEASVFAHSPPEVWLIFPAPKGRAQGSSSDGGATVRLFFLPDNPLPLAVVHLTWAGRREKNPEWPQTTFYASLDDWVERCMKPDHLGLERGPE